jgi:hypothetical protein
MTKAPAALTKRITEEKIHAPIGEIVIFRMYSATVNTARGGLNAEKLSNKINCPALFTE